MSFTFFWFLCDLHFQAEDAEGDLEDEDDDEEMLLPPRRRAHDHDEDEEEEEEDGIRGRSNHPAQASVLYQDLLMSDGEDDASEEEGDNPFYCKFHAGTEAEMEFFFFVAACLKQQQQQQKSSFLWLQHTFVIAFISTQSYITVLPRLCINDGRFRPLH